MSGDLINLQGLLCAILSSYGNLQNAFCKNTSILLNALYKIC